MKLTQKRHDYFAGAFGFLVLEVVLLSVACNIPWDSLDAGQKHPLDLPSQNLIKLVDCDPLPGEPDPCDLD